MTTFWGDQPKLRILDDVWFRGRSSTSDEMSKLVMVYFN